MENSVQRLYGNRLRVRACGVLIENKKLLLVNHVGLTESNFWSPPGGGVSFGEETKQALIREMLEETGLVVQVNNFLFAGEFIKESLHAIELFFSVSKVSGEVHTGIDPEHTDVQLIKEVKWLSWDEIQWIAPSQRHGIFSHLNDLLQIEQLSGYFKM